MPSLFLIAVGMMLFQSIVKKDLQYNKAYQYVIAALAGIDGAFNLYFGLMSFWPMSILFGLLALFIAYRYLQKGNRL